MKGNNKMLETYEAKTIRLETDKATFVSEVFDSVARKYDMMNDIMSLGIHRHWKNRFMSIINPTSSMSLVDVGGGTGDIAFRFIRRGGKEANIVDINYKMLHQGRSRHQQRLFKSKIKWINGDAGNLPLKSYSADIYTASFCLRNVSSIEAALIEAHRILKPGGRFLCLEFSKVNLPVLDKIYDRYSYSVLPKLGEMIVKDRGAYQYLVDSIRCFPNQEQFSRLIKKAGFAHVKHLNLSAGIAAIHSAWRL